MRNEREISVRPRGAVRLPKRTCFDERPFVGDNGKSLGNLSLSSSAAPCHPRALTLLRHLFSLVTRSTGRKRLSINFAVNKGERRQKVRKRRALLLAPREESIVYYSGLSCSIYMYTPSPSSLLLSRYSRTSRSESRVPRFKTLDDVIPFVLRFECTYDEN